MVQEQRLQLRMKFFGGYNKNCYLVREINLWWEGVYWGGDYFSAGGRTPWNPFEHEKPWASTIALHTPAPIYLIFI